MPRDPRNSDEQLWGNSLSAISARNRADDSAITKTILGAGAYLVSTTEAISTTPSGMLLHGIMASIAEFYSQNLAAEVTKGLTQKIATGGTPTRAPLG